MFEKGEVITLDDDKNYFVYDLKKYNDDIFALLVDVLDNKIFKVYRCEDDELYEVVDPELSSIKSIFEEYKID